MNNKPIIALFEENELNIAALYSLYAQMIPEKERFWNTLSNEEVAHAAQIGNEKEKADAIEENKFARGVIKYVMDFVLDEIKKAQSAMPDHENALLAALRIERSMMERKCFDLFSPTNKSVEEVFQRMNKETERHIQRLLSEIKKNKFSLQ